MLHTTQARSASEIREDQGPISRNSFVEKLFLSFCIAGIVVLFIFLWSIVDALVVFFAAIFLAVFFSGLANSVKTHLRLNYPLSLLLSLSILLGLCGGTGILIGPGIADQLTDVYHRLPDAYHASLDQLQHSNVGIHLYQFIQNGIGDAKESVRHVWVRFAGVTIHGLSETIFAIIIGIFLAADPDLYRNGLLMLFPRPRQKRVGQILDEIGATLWRWLLAQILTMVSVGILISIGLAILGVPLPGTLGLLAGLLAFIPSLGPLLSLIPAALFGLSISPATGMYVALLYLGVQTLEANVISPFVQQKAIQLPPAFVLASELVMGLLLGAVGLMFATPLAAVLIVLVKTLYVEDVLGRSTQRRATAKGKGTVESRA